MQRELTNLGVNYTVVRALNFALSTVKKISTRSLYILSSIARIQQINPNAFTQLNSFTTSAVISSIVVGHNAEKILKIIRGDNPEIHDFTWEIPPIHPRQHPGSLNILPSWPQPENLPAHPALRKAQFIRPPRQVTKKTGFLVHQKIAAE